MISAYEVSIKMSTKKHITPKEIEKVKESMIVPYLKEKHSYKSLKESMLKIIIFCDLSQAHWIII